MDPLVAVLVVVVVVLSILLVVVGVQVIVILKEFKKTLGHVNRTLDEADHMFHLISRPFGGLGDTVAGLRTGMKVVESFVSWLKEHQGLLHEQNKVSTDAK